MSRCQHLIDISPYDPLCDHPCRLYGGGAVEAECETCQYRIADLEAENAKLRELVRDYERCTMHADCSKCEYDGKLSTHCPLSPCFPDADELRELGVEVDG